MRWLHDAHRTRDDLPAVPRGTAHPGALLPELRADASVQGYRNDGEIMHIRVVIPMRTYSKLNERMHWSKVAKVAKRERQEAYFRMREAYPFQMSMLDIMGPITIKLTRTGPTHGLDGDNLVSSFKSVRDGVSDWLKINDGDPRLVFSYAQERHDRWRVIIEVEGPDK